MGIVGRFGAIAIVVIALTACTRPDADIATPNTAPLDPVGTNTLPTVPATGHAEPTTAPTATTTLPAPSSTTTSEATSATSVRAPTTSSVTTTVPAPPSSEADLTLFYDGVLPFRFGDRDVDVIPGLTAALGTPVTDAQREYPNADQGFFIDPATDESYVARFGRTTCFANALCVQFGAGAPETRIFTGWALDDTEASVLETEAGIRIGSVWADFADVIVVDPTMSCYQVAYTSVDGIDLALLSADGAFAAPNDAGELVPGDPDPNQVTVTRMSAGQLPEYRFADC